MTRYWVGVALLVLLVVFLMVYETVFMKTNVSTILSKVGTPAP